AAATARARASPFQGRSGVGAMQAVCFLPFSGVAGTTTVFGRAASGFGLRGLFCDDQLFYACRAEMGATGGHSPDRRAGTAALANPPGTARPSRLTLP